MGVPLYVICHLSLVAFNTLSLIFVNLITMCLGVFVLGFILYGTRCTSWTWVAISFPMLGKFSTIISSNIFSGPVHCCQGRKEGREGGREGWKGDRKSVV